MHARELFIDKPVDFFKHIAVAKRKKSGKLYISDTTLRDGEQTPGVNLLPEEKLQIAEKLAEIGIDSIDAGFPVSSRSDFKAIELISQNIRGPIITALCRAKHEDIDAAWECLKYASVNKRGVSIFIGTSPIHREKKLKKTKEEILETIVDSVKYARKKGFEIIAASPEDASRTELEFLCEFYETAIKAGATAIGFTDTLGILTPRKTKQYITGINENLPNRNKALFGIHFHNDLGLATANSLVAIETGYVDSLQGTIIGMGERAGNTSIEEVVIAMMADGIDNYPKKPEIKINKLYETAKLVEKLTEIPICPYKPVVGANVFRTEAGIHQDGLLKDPKTYLPFDPSVVGGPEVTFYIGKKSGIHALEYVLSQNGFNVTPEQADTIMQAFKNQCSERKDVSEADLIRIAKSVIKE